MAMMPPAAARLKCGESGGALSFALSQACSNDSSKAGTNGRDCAEARVSSGFAREKDATGELCAGGSARGTVSTGATAGLGTEESEGTEGGAGSVCFGLASFSDFKKADETVSGFSLSFSGAVFSLSGTVRAGCGRNRLAAEDS